MQIRADLCCLNLLKAATGQKQLFLSQKKSRKRRLAEYNTPFLGDFWHQKYCFRRVFKMTADLSLLIVDFFPFIFPFNHIVFSIAWIWKCRRGKITGVNSPLIFLTMKMMMAQRVKTHFFSGCFSAAGKI